MQVLRQPYLYFFLSVLTADFLVRFYTIMNWNWSQKLHYTLCAVGSLLLWKCLIELCAALFKKKTVLSILSAAVICILSVVAVAIPFTVYNHYRTFPTLEGYLFFANTIAFSVSGAGSLFLWRDFFAYVIAGVIFLLAVTFTKVPKKQKGFYWKRLLYVFAFATTVSVVKVSRVIPLTAESNTIRLVANVISWGSTPPEFFTLSPRNNTPYVPPKDKKIESFNYLFIIGETLSAAYVRDYNGTHSAPNLQGMLDHPNSVHFSKMHANASCSDLSIPSTMTAVQPTTPLNRFLQGRVAFDYFYPLGYRTFHVSSHRLDWAYLGRFIGKANLDFIQSARDIKDNPPPEFHVGVPDTHAYKAALEQMDLAYAKKMPFAGVINTLTTHPPYQIDANNLPFDKVQGLPNLEGQFRKYLNSVTYYDKMLGDFLKSYFEKPYAKDTVILFTADHGEAFGQHGIISHCGKYYREESNVPSFIFAPESYLQSPGAKERIENLKKNKDEFTSNVDLLPTMLDLAGIYTEDLDFFMDGRPLTKPLDPKRVYVFSNCADFRRCPIPHFGFFFDGYKYLYHADEKRWEAFSVADDPDDTKNVYEDKKAVAESLLPRLKQDPTIKDLLESKRFF